MTNKTSQARLDANARYRKKSVKYVSVKFFPADHYLSDWIDEQPESRTAYIKRLIREDYEKNHQQ